MSVALINPNLVFQNNDPFTTGIVYMPVSLAYFAAALRKAGFPIHVLDAFAESTQQIRHQGNFGLIGLTEAQIVAQLPQGVKIAFVYAINLTNHISTMGIVRALRRANSELSIVVLENTQAVSAYALKYVAGDFYQAGASYILTGESEERGISLVSALLQGDHARVRQMDGIGSPEFYNPPLKTIDDLDALAFPAWDLFPLENYWRLHFAHGPQESPKYLPLLTSRGCPYPCEFCVVPATNNQKWRPRSAKNVVDEIEDSTQRYGVREFHLEDLDPTISDQRVREICDEISRRKLHIVWKIAAGTKVETIRNDETIDRMAKAGCRYISISPETGSPRVLKLMNKPFNLEHAVRLVKRMNQVGIFSQACFVLGFPGETVEDREMTRRLVHDLTRVGVDEIALFIITPVPGSSIYGQFTGYNSLSQLNFTPTWRADYAELSRFRLKLYISFLLWKTVYHPLKLLRQPFNFLLRRFKTKMEMVPYRAMKLKWLERQAPSHIGLVRNQKDSKSNESFA